METTIRCSICGDNKFVRQYRIGSRAFSACYHCFLVRLEMYCNDSPYNLMSNALLKYEAIALIDRERHLIEEGLYTPSEDKVSYTSIYDAKGLNSVVAVLQLTRNER